MVNLFDLEIELETDNGIYLVLTEVIYKYDEGYTYDYYGEGCPPSSEMEYTVKMIFAEDESVIYSENGNIELPEGLCEQDIEDKIWLHIENNY